MPLALGYHWVTQQVLAGYTGTLLEKLSWNCPTLECHWRNCIAAYTGTPPPPPPTPPPPPPPHPSPPPPTPTPPPLHPPTPPHTHTHRYMQGSIHPSLKWQDGGTTSCMWTDVCKFSFYLGFTALQCIPVLLFKHVSTSTSFCACLEYEHHYSFCIFGFAV